jgi:hypothetical protein
MREVNFVPIYLQLRFGVVGLIRHLMIESCIHGLYVQSGILRLLHAVFIE